MRVLARGFALMGRDGGRFRPRSEQAMGIALILGAILGFTLMDATAKYLTQTYHPMQVIWWRFTGNLLILLAIFRGGVLPAMRSRHPSMQFARALTQMGSVGLFFTAIQYIGLAEATAIMDLNPVLITLGAALFLGEKVGPRRIAGIVAALIGAMIIIRPGAGVFQPAALLPLAGAFTFAAGALLTRMTRADTPTTSVMWSAVIGTILFSAILPFVWEPVAPSDFWAFGLLAIFGTASQYLLVRAFSTAEAGVLAPFGYTGLIWAGVWGWMFFGQIPDLWTIGGAAIIVIAGLYVWSREARAARKG
ncbi:DMT family transporter [Paracoccus sp. 1_MG-2023]|uniref:DMT family transporter n=1 Tax=unclassified Paracoccus (in: a-proteobacteria) TaxID=2688777 RepID=UPI001C0856EB|nr:MULTISPECIES: DMT family transporter [unclassified Paracoccus (in: a-proteobacteria)]MBU2958512.1 DMT family transporter [Paracoccus sp. C2R09]MDO6668503.1 DMT family transporter [Paracoccus sp. 1_MG-2023]